MKVGVGLPATIPNVPDGLIVEWAKKADDLGFHSLGIIDRTVYSNHEVMISLAAAAAVTKRIRLMTTVLILPARETGLIAKQIATLDRISGGRVIWALQLDQEGKTTTLTSVSSRIEEGEWKSKLR